MYTGNKVVLKTFGTERIDDIPLSPVECMVYKHCARENTTNYIFEGLLFRYLNIPLRRINVVYCRAFVLIAMVVIVAESEL